MPKCTINGKEIEVPSGASIIEAYQAAGEEIAHYCWHPGLSVAGVCRMCVCEIKGNSKPQIACNTAVTEGMVVTNQTEAIKDQVKWILGFHLINHPLDCPVCDQAGECGLQEYYMTHGLYTPDMGEKKVKKRKVVDLGERVVLDTERCILCSRCVRFTDEVSKTHELGIFNRGDHAEIGTHADKPLNNNYSTNVVDICPVGALTSKDFRFRQRVWFLKNFDTVCTGCSTGCNTKVSYNENGLYRIKPNYNKDVNGHWMCDVGRDIYKYLNIENRLTKAIHNNNDQDHVMSAGGAAKRVGESLREQVKTGGADSVALVLTAQYTTEELQALTEVFAKEFVSKNIFYWKNNPENFEAFDEILYRGDRNPNTKGLEKVMKQYGVDTNWDALVQGVATGKIKTVVVAGPENQEAYPDIAKRVAELKNANVIWMSACPNESFNGFQWQIPMKSYIEKDGTFTNFKGIDQTIRKGTIIVSEALTLTEAAYLLSGKNLPVQTEKPKFAMGAV